MSAIEGLEELRQALQNLPAELAGEAATIVDQAAARTEARLLANYPDGDSGNLKGGVSRESTLEAAGARAVVRSKSPHAHLWEFGTQNRQTRAGWARGQAPSHRPEGLVTIADEERARMNDELVALLARAGLEVSGRP